MDMGKVMSSPIKIKLDDLRLGQYLCFNMSVITTIKVKEPTRSNIAMPEILCSLNVAIDMFF